MMAAQPKASRPAALDDLDFFWGDVYDFAFSRGKWVARTGDGARTLLAGSPGELRVLAGADYQAHPVPRRDTHEGRAVMDQPQARALRELDARWGEFYVITLGSHGWMARPRGSGHLLVAATPAGLAELIEAGAGADAGEA